MMRVMGHAMPLLSDKGAPGVCNKPTVLCVCDMGGSSKVQDPGWSPSHLYLRVILAGGDVCCCRIFGKRCDNIC